ncbi:hypothetical protein ACQPYK_28605 [Streptosporangium sp. CA-135522]|uniref:hypothetical protein n=1 Tax=Streptosporangium sp. CA-135522 TaxID=3240072 RepID=UPI003D934AF6
MAYRQRPFRCSSTPILEGSPIRLQVERLPGDNEPKPVWLWSSHTGLTAEQVDRLWQVFPRRFDLEHTFRLFKQTLGWTTHPNPEIPAPDDHPAPRTADRHPTTTSAKPSSEKPPSLPGLDRQVKDQA